MAGPIASALLRIRGDASGAKRALLATKTGLGGVGSSLRRIGEIAAAIGLVKLFYAAAQAIRSFVTKIVSATSEMQRLGLSIQVLLARELAKAATEAGNLGDAVAHAGDYFEAASVPAAALIKEIQRFGLLSPYSIQATANMYKLALAFGWGRDMSMDLTKALLNTAAGLGLTRERANRLAFNLLQLQTQGQLMQRDFREMGMVGYDLAAVLQEVSRIVGINIKDHKAFNRLLRQGRVTWEDFGHAIMAVAERDFGPAAEKFSTTLTGIKENLGDVASVISVVFLPTADLIGEWAKSALDALLELSESGKLEDAGKKLRTWVEDLVFDISFVLQNIKAEGLSGAVSALWRLGSIEWAFGKELEIFAESLDNLWAALKNLGEVSWGLVIDGLNQLFSLFSDVDTPSMKETAEGIDTVTASINNIATFMTTYGDAISGGIAAIVGSFLMVKSIAFVGGILAAIASGLSLIAVVSAGPLMWAIGAITALGMHLGGFANIGELLGAAQVGFRNLMELIFALATKAVVVWGQIWEAAYTTVQQVITLIVALVAQWVAGVAGGFQAIWTTILQIIAIILHNISTFGNNIREEWDKIKRSAAIWVSGILTIITAKVQEFITAGKDILGGLWEGLKSKWAEILAWAEEAWAKLTELLNKIFGTHSPSTVFAEIGENLMLGLGEGIRRAGADVQRSLAIQTRQFSGVAQLQLAPTQALAGGSASRTTQSTKQVTIAPGAIQITVGDKEDIMETTLVFEDSLTRALEELPY